MKAKLDRNGWLEVVRNHRPSSDRKSFSEAVKAKRASQPKRFTETIAQHKAKRPPSLRGKNWTARIAIKTQAGGRYRSRGYPSQQKQKRVQRPTGGLLKTTSPRVSKPISEVQKSGAVVKLGHNAINSGYDYRQLLAQQRSRAIKQASQLPKRGINAQKWHYDHQKANSQVKPAGPTTHVSAEKKRLSQLHAKKNKQQLSQRPQQPKRPAKPRQPDVQKPKAQKAKAPVVKKG